MTYSCWAVQYRHHASLPQYSPFYLTSYLQDVAKYDVTRDRVALNSRKTQDPTPHRPHQRSFDRPSDSSFENFVVRGPSRPRVIAR